MAAIRPDKQKFENLLPNLIIGMHLVTPVSTSDTFTVPKLANTTASQSSKILRRGDGNNATVTDDGTNTITVAGTAGQQVLIATSHESMVNFGDED